MAKGTLFTIVESPAHPKLSSLYKRMGYDEVILNSQRKAISQLKKQTPDVVMAEFFYGYGNNYAGVNISNLDVFLFSLQKYAPRARVIVFVDKTERQYVDKLNDIFPLHAVLQYPVTAEQVEQALAEKQE